MMKPDVIEQNRRSWNAMADSWFGATSLPRYGCLCPTEDELQLLPELTGKRVLEMGCGSGHSLKWCHERGAGELWGVDLSDKQLENARRLLEEAGASVRLIRSPMEAECGLPKAYFDVVLAVYSLGWATDLEEVMMRIAAYLKPGGVLVFSWDHPLMHVAEAQNGQLVLAGQYVKDEVFSYEQRGQRVTVHNHRMSSWLNALARAGLRFDRLVEETDPAVLGRSAEFTSQYYSDFRAQKMPLSFIVRAVKPDT